MAGNKDFRLLLASHAVNSTGSGMVPVALTYALLQGGYGVGGVGTVLGAEALAMLLFLLLGGVVGDRFPRRTILLATHGTMAATQSVLGWLLWGGHPAIWLVAALAAADGAGRAFYSPAAAGLLSTLGTQGSRHRMNSLWGMAGAFGGMAGPAAGGILVATVGAGPAVALDALSYAAALAMTSMLAGGRETTGSGESFLEMIAGGWKEFSGRDWLWAFVAQFALLQLFCFAPFYVDGPVLVGTDGEGARSWGIILACEGVGAVLGGVVAYRIRPRRPMFWSVAAVFLLALPTVFLAMRAGTAWVAAGMVASGVGVAVCNALWNSVIQQEVPPGALARVKAFDVLGSNSMAPLGYALAGPVAAAIGETGAMWLGSAVVVVTTAMLLCLGSVRTLGWRHDGTG